ncbi:hypothetical protein Fmac_023816 [Flemingia macrophylla]|uniref:Lipoprotein n=1 Tax=Flemingia macrophylla TaxID=520843 RepID=A0ABD1LMQ4_9FABA
MKNTIFRERKSRSQIQGSDRLGTKTSLDFSSCYIISYFFLFGCNGSLHEKLKSF